MIMLIDNYDSFTFNLYQYIGTFTEDIRVVRNDVVTIDEIRAMKPERIVLSPGPKSPKDAGICMDVVKTIYREIPILGIWDTSVSGRRSVVRSVMPVPYFMENSLRLPTMELESLMGSHPR